MTEQQLAAVKQAVESMTDADRLLEDEGYGRAYQQEAITALQSIISQDALDKKAENARELGLSYDTPLSSFVRSNDEAKAEVMERVIDKAIEAQKEKIGCVNHDCDKCKAVQEPVGEVYRYGKSSNGTPWHGIHWFDEGVDMPHGTPLYTAPPAPQPIPVKTYHDGKPWPVQPKPWVGLTKEDKEFIELTGGKSDVLLAELVEAKLKEKNT